MGCASKTPRAPCPDPKPILAPGKGPAELQPSETPELMLLWVRTGDFLKWSSAKCSSPIPEGAQSWARWEPRELSCAILPRAQNQHPTRQETHLGCGTGAAEPSFAPGTQTLALPAPSVTLMKIYRHTWADFCFRLALGAVLEETTSESSTPPSLGLAHFQILLFPPGFTPRGT